MPDEPDADDDDEDEVVEAGAAAAVDEELVELDEFEPHPATRRQITISAPLQRRLIDLLVILPFTAVLPS
jgi:hypothetical protein